MRTSHLTIAADEGAKAGFRAYMEAKTPLAAARREQIRAAGNSTKQFNAYCSLFKKELDRIAAEKHGAEQRDDVLDDITDSLQGDPESTIRRLARLLSRDTGVQAFEDDVDDDTDDDEPETVDGPIVNGEQDIPVATRITWPMCTALFKRAKKWGEVVTITARDGETARDYDYHLDIEFSDGSVEDDITPEFASELIGEFKDAN